MSTSHDAGESNSAPEPEPTGFNRKARESAPEPEPTGFLGRLLDGWYEKRETRLRDRKAREIRFAKYRPVDRNRPGVMLASVPPTARQGQRKRSRQGLTSQVVQRWPKNLACGQQQTAAKGMPPALPWKDLWQWTKRLTLRLAQHQRERRRRITEALRQASATVTVGCTEAAGQWGQCLVTGEPQGKRRRDGFYHPAIERLEPRMMLSVNPIGTESLLNTTTNNDQRSWEENAGNVAVFADGSYVSTWSSMGQDGDGWGVFAQRFDAGDQKVGVEFQVNSTTNNKQRRAHVAAGPDGGSIIVWESSGQDGHYTGIYGQRYDVSGNAVGGEFQINVTTNGFQEFPSVVFLANGNFVVTWSGRGEGDNSGVFARVFGSDGTALTGEIMLNQETGNVQTNSAIAATDDGFLAVWQSHGGQDGDNRGVFARRFNADGTAAGNEFLVNTATTGHQQIPAITVAGDGSFVFAWQSHAGQDGAGIGIFAQRYDAAGQPVGSEFQVNTFTDNDQEVAAVAFDGGGGFVIAWQGKGSEDNSGIYARRFEADGTADGDQFLVNTTTDNAQRFATVAGTPDGFMITWSGKGAGDNEGLFGQRYTVVQDANQPPEVAVPGAQTVDEDDDLIISGISIADPDVGAGDLEVSLSAANGLISLGSLNGLTFTAGDGTQDVAVTFTGTLADVGAALVDLLYQGNANFGGTDAVTIAVNDLGNTGGAPKSDTESVTINVTPVADVPALTVQDAGGDEDTAIPLNLSASLSDTDGSEVLTVTISGVPAGAVLSAGTDNGGGVWTLTAAQLAGLTITPPAHSDADFTLTVTATATEQANGDFESVQDTIQFTVTAVADAPTLTVQPASGAEDTAISLDIQAALVDTDSSESLSIVVSSVPAGAALSAGTDNGDGSWTLTAAQLAGLTFTPPQDFNGQITLTATATATESSNSDSASISDSLMVTVDAVNDGPVLTVPGAQSVPNNVATPIPGVSITDVDVNEGTGQVQVMLSATGNGKLTINPTAALSFSIGDGFEDESMTFSGSLSDVNAALANLEFRGDEDSTIMLTVNDQGNTGTGDEQFDTKAIEVTVGANTPPVATSTTVAVQENSGSHTVDLFAIFDDIEDLDTDLQYQLLYFPDSLFDSAALDVTSNSADLVFDLAADRNGLGQILVRATDTGGLSVDTSVLVNVNPVNVAPQLLAVGDQSVAEGEFLTLALEATDGDPEDQLTYFLDAGPEGATIDPLTGVFGWAAPMDHGPGSHAVTVSVVDSGLSSLDSTQSFTIQVTDTNEQPTLDLIGGTTLPVFDVQEGDPIEFDVSASDPDDPADALNFTLENAPQGMTIESTGDTTARVAWTPTSDQGGATYNVVVRVTDDGSPALSHSQSVAIAVGDINQPPTLNTIASQTIAEGDLVTFTATASDPDSSDTLRFSLSGAPTGMAIDPLTGEVSWTPSEAQGPATYFVTVTVADGITPLSLSDSQQVQVTVEEVNQPPIVQNPGTMTATEGEQFAVRIFASDPDLPAPSLMYSLDSGPANAVIDGLGRLTWTPGENDGGTSAQVTVRVADGFSSNPDTLSTTMTFTIDVAEDNHPPVVSISDASPSISDGVISVFFFDSSNPPQEVRVRVSATDFDTPAQGIQFTIEDGPGALIEESGETFFVWNVNPADGPRTHNIRLRGTDSGGLFDDEVFKVAVTAPEGSGSGSGSGSSSPVFPPIAHDDFFSTQHHQPVSGNVLANDSVSSDRNITFTQPTNGTLDFDAATGDFEYTPDGDFVGLDSFTYTVTNDPGNASEFEGGDSTGIVTIDLLNFAPSAVNDSYFALAGVERTIDAASGVLADDTDSNGDALTATVLHDVQHGQLMLNPNGSFTYTAAAGFQGLDSFYYHVSDGFEQRTGFVLLDVQRADVDLNTDSNNDGFLTGADDQVEADAPGHLAVVTGDPDNVDRSRVTLATGISGLTSELLAGLTVRLEGDSSKIKVTNFAGDEISLDTVWAVDEVPPDAWVELLEEGAANLDLVLLNGSEEIGRDSVLFTGISPYAIDLDIDSDNTNGFDSPDRSQEEEDLEDDSFAAKVLPSFEVDLDGDGVVDWADGYDLIGDVAVDDESPELKFTPLVLEIPEWVDLNSATITLSYAASNPAFVSQRGPNDAGEAEYSAPSEAIRLWSVDGSTSRNKNAIDRGGNYLAPGTYSAASLSITEGNRTAMFFVEAIKPLAGLLPITATLNLANTVVGAFLQQSDTVKVAPDPITAIDFMSVADAGYGELKKNANPDANTPNAPDFKGGHQFFPGAKSYQTSDSGNNIVRVRASLDPNLLKVGDEIFFRVFDVDDPSSDQRIDSNGNQGNDNLGALNGVDFSQDGGSAGAPASTIQHPLPGRGFLRPIKADGSAGTWNQEPIVGATVRSDAAGNLFAEVDLATTFAPGDNYRVAASLTKVSLELNKSIPNKNAAAVTPQLSVWRYFHVEQDRMASTSSADTRQGDYRVLPNGDIRAAIAITEPHQYAGGQFIPHPGDPPLEILGNAFSQSISGTVTALSLLTDSAIVSITLTKNTTLPEDFYKNGILEAQLKDASGIDVLLAYDIVFSGKVDAGTTISLIVERSDGNYSPISPAATMQPIDVRIYEPLVGLIRLKNSTLQPGEEGFATIFEDDFAFDGTSVTTRVDTTTPALGNAGMYDKMVNTTDLRSNPYASAYLIPRLDTLDDFDTKNNDPSSFVTAMPHLKHPEAETIAVEITGTNAFAGSLSFETSFFWTVYASTAYEGGAWHDGDGTSSLAGLQAGQGALIFLETIRDITAAVNAPDALGLTTVHEIGHQFGLSQKKIPDPTDPTKMIVDPEGHGDDPNFPSIMDAGNAVADRFHPLDILTLRKNRRSPEKP